MDTGDNHGLCHGLHGYVPEGATLTPTHPMHLLVDHYLLGVKKPHPGVELTLSRTFHRESAQKESEGETTRSGGSSVENGRALSSAGSLVSSKVDPLSPLPMALGAQGIHSILRGNVGTK